MCRHATRNAMINFDALIRDFGPEAIQRVSIEADWDGRALDAMCAKGAERRLEVIRDWLSSYAVFQGIDGSRRDSISKAVLDWADSQPTNSTLVTLEGVIQALTVLENACSQADGRKRN